MGNIVHPITHYLLPITQLRSPSWAGNFKPICLSIILGVFCYSLYWSALFIALNYEISEEKLIGHLNYPSYGKTIYVYAEKRCFFDCNLYYLFWLQYGWLPVMHSIANLEAKYDYNK